MWPFPNLIRLLLKRSLSIDDCPDDHYPPAIGWHNRGVDPDEFKTPQLFADVRSLKNGKSIFQPYSF
jgi:hypothetical protein